MAWPAKANQGKGCLSVYLYAGLGSAPAVFVSFNYAYGEILASIAIYKSKILALLLDMDFFILMVFLKRLCDEACNI